MTDFDNRLNTGWWALRIGLGVGPIITGMDKYFNKLTDWRVCISTSRDESSAGPTVFMDVVGLVEIVAGLIILSHWTKIGSYIVMF